MSVERRSPPAAGSYRQTAPQAKELDWQADGLCRDYPPEMFVPDEPNVARKSREAAKICAHCPVLDECRQWGLSNYEQWGVWGGLSERQRRAIWKRTRDPKAALAR